MLLNRSGKILVPLVTRLNMEEEYKRHKKFERMIDLLLDNLEDLSDDDYYYDENELCNPQPRILLPFSDLQDVLGECVKLKALSTMHLVSDEKLLQIMKILEKNICYGSKQSSTANMLYGWDDKQTCENWKVASIRAAAASLVALNIMTSYKISRKLNQEDILNATLTFTKHQLERIIYCLYDPSYAAELVTLDIESMKRNLPAKDVRKVYGMICQIVSLCSELLECHTLSESSILQMISFSTASFFIEDVNDLQLSALRLVTKIFAKYESYQKTILDDIIVNIMKLPSINKGFSKHKLHSGNCINMWIALVLLLVESAVHVTPAALSSAKGNNSKRKSDTVCYDSVLIDSYQKSCRVAAYFLSEFFTSNDAKFGPIMEMFVLDLFTAVYSPEWPAADLMLSLLANLLSNKIKEKGVDIARRLCCLELLGTITARLKKECKEKTPDIEDITPAIQLNKASCESEEQMQLLQDLLLKYFNAADRSDVYIRAAREYLLIQWYCELGMETQHGLEDYRTSKSSSGKRDSEITVKDRRKQHFIDQLFFNSSLSREGCNSDVKCTSSIYRALLLRRPLFKNCCVHLKPIIGALAENAVSLRTKAVKCLVKIIDADCDVIDLDNVQQGVKYSFLDNSVPVREATVDLIGKYLVNNSHMIDRYYDLIVTRVLDTAVSVRKRVIKLLKELYLTNPDEFPRKLEVMEKIIRRINDPEESVRKLVVDIFESRWFCNKKNSVCKQTAMELLNVTMALKEADFKSLELLLNSILKPDNDITGSSANPSKEIINASRQIIESVWQIMPTLDEMSTVPENDRSKHILVKKLLICVTVVHLFVKVQPKPFLKYAKEIVTYLDIPCESQDSYEVLHMVISILNITLPLMKSPTKCFLEELQNQLVSIILTSDSNAIITSSISTLSILISLSRDYEIIRSWFGKYYRILLQYKDVCNVEVLDSPQKQANRSEFLRTLFIFGLLIRYFDIDEAKIYESDTAKQAAVFETLFYFMEQPDEDVRHFTLKCIGSICVRHSDFFLDSRLVSLYNRILSHPDVKIRMKIQVLCNIEMYMNDKTSVPSKNERVSDAAASLKDIGDKSNYVSSMVIQNYLKNILQSFLHRDSRVRCAVSKLLYLIVCEGQMHPVQLLPYLISMTTDSNSEVSLMAKNLMKEISSKYSAFLYTSYQKGMQLSFKLQQILHEGVTVRGLTLRGKEPESLNDFMYSFVRNKKEQRRALALWILGSAKNHDAKELPELLYLCDNLAYFPYQMLDEPLFIIKHIDITVSMYGSTALQNFRNCLLNGDSKQQGERSVPVDGSGVETQAMLLARLPQDTTIMQDSVVCFHRYRLLASLRAHLKETYNLTEEKILEYSACDSPKTFEKRTSKHTTVLFEPPTLAFLEKASLTPEQLVDEYVNFNALMEDFDPSCEDILTLTSECYEMLKTEDLTPKEASKSTSKRRALVNIKNTLIDKEHEYVKQSKCKKPRRIYIDSDTDSDC